jgi:hypothetical protein
VKEQFVVRSVPKRGDLLVSRRSARTDVYDISVISDRVHTVARTYREAVEKVSGLAGILAVDAWFTCDHTHFASIARHRSSTP